MAGPAPGEELVPTLNQYVRSKLRSSEVLTFADCARALGERQAAGWPPDRIRARQLGAARGAA
jgi:hypothetical protein